MDSTWLHPALPHALPLAFAFASCFVSGTLAIGEGIVFMLLYNISRSYGLLGGGAPRFQGVLFSQLISAFSQLPVVFAGRHEMAIVLGYGVVMVIVSLCFITLGVGMLLSGQEDVFLLYSGGVFMLFSFWQILKCSVEFGEERLNCAAPVSRQVTLDPTGTSVISTLDYSPETLALDFSLLSRLLQSQPRSLSVLHDTSPPCNSDLCVKILQTVVFPDDNSSDTELMLCRCIASMLAAHVAACSDLSTLLREDCTRQHHSFTALL